MCLTIKCKIIRSRQMFYLAKQMQVLWLNRREHFVCILYLISFIEIGEVVT